MATKIGVAVFGAGRIGTIHISNLFLMEQVDLRYIIEEDVSRAAALVQRYRLQDVTKVLSMDQANEALSDPV